METKTTQGAANAAPQNSTVPANIEKNISDSVLARVNQFEQAGALKLPKDYSAANALKVAFLQLTDMAVDNKPVLQHCTQASIANALLKMVTQGLNPMKRQCAFIPYGNSLTMQREYQGTIALAKRYGLKDVNANVIYEGDDFKYEVDPSTGIKKLIEHKQDFMNIDLEKIKGAYAIAVTEDGRTILEVMNINQIRKAWAMGKGGGNTKAHTNFTDEMAKKSVINRICKPIINSSDDSNLMDDDDETPAGDKVVATEIKQNANVEHLDFAEAEVVSSKPAQNNQPVDKKEPEKKNNTQAQNSTQTTINEPGF